MFLKGTKYCVKLKYSTLGGADLDIKKLIAKDHLKVQRKTLTAQEVAEYIGVHPDTIYTMVREKQIPHFRVRRRIFFSMETINAWMRDLENKSFEAI